MMLYQKERKDPLCTTILLAEKEKARFRKPLAISHRKIFYLNLVNAIIKKTLQEVKFKGIISIGRYWGQLLHCQICIEGGLWQINDHYLIITEWTPNFIHDNAPMWELVA